MREIWLGVGIAALAGAGIIAFRLLRRKPSAEELERRRRLLILETGKLGDAEVIDVDGTLIIYSYVVAGVNYTVSQDASAFEAQFPEDRMTLVGPALIRFIPRNPANSIVMCEGWSGLRIPAL